MITWDCKLKVYNRNKDSWASLKRCLIKTTSTMILRNIELDFVLTHWNMKLLTEFYGLSNRPYWDVKVLKEV